MSDPGRRNRNVGVILWALGTLGGATVVLTWSAVTVAGQGIPAPSLLGYATIVAVTVMIGTSLAPAVGLRAPVVEELAAGRSIAAPLRAQIVPGLIGGALGALFALVLAQMPSADVATSISYSPRLITRVMGGGISEEIFFRWGAMSLVAWLLWRFFQHDTNKPRPSLVWGAIAISAVLFGAYHLPVAPIGPLSPAVIAFVVAGPTMFGVVTGFLFWRYGLEAAIIAHAMAHIFYDLFEAL